MCKFHGPINQWVLSLFAAVCAQPDLLAGMAKGSEAGMMTYSFKLFYFSTMILLGNKRLIIILHSLAASSPPLY